MSAPLVNLYELRRAIAALVWARHSITERQRIDRDQVTLVDDAIRVLGEIAGELRSDLAGAARLLLSHEPDPGGRRTMRAIDRLGELAYVNADNAPAIASLRPTEPVDAGPPRMFNPDSGLAS